MRICVTELSFARADVEAWATVAASEIARINAEHGDLGFIAGLPSRICDMPTLCYRSLRRQTEHLDAAPASVVHPFYRY
jgi:hypothetical protein